jgi:hypothetical protein
MVAPLSFREIIRKKLTEGFVTINELFYMKNFSVLQVEVLRSVAETLGAGATPTDVNNFLMSPLGREMMKIYRQILIRRFGDVGKGMPNSDEAADPGFNPANLEAHKALVKSIADELVSKVQGVKYERP